MPSRKGIPSLRRHAPSGLGAVVLSGQWFYLGRWPEGQADPPAGVRREYNRVVAEWLARNRQPEPAEAVPGAAQAGGRLLVAEMVLRYLEYAEVYYRKRDGARTSELSNVTLALRPLVHAYGRTPAEQFGPVKLKAVRALLAAGCEHPEYGPQPGVVRGQVNARVTRIVRAFRWAVSEDLVPVAVWQALKSVPGLEKGRSAAKESEPVQPADPAAVEAPAVRDGGDGAVPAASSPARCRRH